MEQVLHGTNLEAETIEVALDGAWIRFTKDAGMVLLLAGFSRAFTSN